MDTITKTNHANIEFVVVVNSDWWAGLDEETQGHIRAAAKVAQDDVRDRMSQIEADAYTAAEENGMTIVELTDAELAAWQEVAQPVIDGYLAATGEAGQKILDALGVNSGS